MTGVRELLDKDPRVQKLMEHALEEDILATHRFLNYSPQISLREGLQKTIEWISEHIDLYKTDIYAV